MILDIIVVLIFLISTMRGKARGFGDSAIRLLTLVAGIVLGTIFTEPLGSFLMSTPLNEYVQERLTAVMSNGEIDLLGFVPGVIGRTLEALGIGSISIDIRHFTNTVILVLAFLLIILAVSIVSVMLRRRLADDRKEGNVIGTVDSTIGFLFGMIKGAILVFLFLAFMFPLAGIFLPNSIEAMNEQLNNSFIAGVLYDFNPLLQFIKQLPL